MPAVRVEPCFVTNPSEERLLREGVLTQQIAAAIVRGIERFFAPAEQMGAESASSSRPPSAV
jgi:N-acetylmuramoyl-L-alanine amidase